MEAFGVHLDEATQENTNFRQVIYTTKYQQLVVMHIEDNIDCEMHPDNDQFIKIEKGYAKVIVEGNTKRLKEGDSITISAGSYHEVVNIGSSPLKLYTIYSPPHHPNGLIQKYKPVQSK